MPLPESLTLVNLLNAVISHSLPLPPHEKSWNHFRYELCDKYGLYVIDEANIETHGFIFYEPPYIK